MIDIPVCYQGYHGDQTRTYVMGKTSPVIRSLYESLRDISDYVILKLNGE